MTRPTERFSGLAEHYRRYRPGYPPAAIDVLARQCGLTSSAVVADVGSGTGILSEQLLERGARVIGIEPNDAMRAAAEARLGTKPCLGRRAHGIVRLDADDPGAVREELLTQDPRSRADIRHHRAGGEPAACREQLDGRRRITGAVAPVILGPA